MAKHYDDINIGENIRLYRIRAGLTIKDLCKRMNTMHQIEVKPGAMRNYEKGTQSVPACVLNSIAAITRAELQEFHEPSHLAILINTTMKQHLLESFSLIQCRASREMLLGLTRKLSKQ